MREELQSLALSLAARVGRPVAIDDPQMHLLVHTPHEGPVDAARMDSILRRQPPSDIVAWSLAHGIAKADSPVRLPPWPERDLLARVCAPVRAGGLLLGYVWLIDAEQSLTDEDLLAVADAAAAAGAVLAREQELEDTDRIEGRALLRSLLGGDPSAARRLEDGHLPAGTDVAVLALTDVPLDELERACRRLPPRTWLAVDDVVVAAGRRAVDDLRAIGAHLESPAGLAGPTPLDAVVVACQQARWARQVCQAVPATGPVATWSELGVYALLVQLPPQDATALHPGLRRLFGADPGGQLVTTLETWLDAAGDPRSTVETLRIHRTSLYYRLGRIEETSGLRLADGQERLSVHVGLKLARLHGLLPTTGVEPATSERRQRSDAPRPPAP